MYGFGARLWKPTLETRQGAIVLAYNVQREEILPSERAFSLKMKMDALRRQGSREDLTSRHDVEKSRESWSSETVGKSMGMGGRQVQRYIRLTELIPEILDYVDGSVYQWFLVLRFHISTRSCRSGYMNISMKTVWFVSLR